MSEAQPTLLMLGFVRPRPPTCDLWIAAGDCH